MPLATPRLVVSAVGGDGGKTLLSLGLIGALRQRGLRIAAFKKGPDYIDASWLARAAGQPAHNLDTFIQERQALIASFAKAAREADLALIEGNRGLFDGMDEDGSHSTAALARILDAPIVVILNVTKVTRTAAAVALGCSSFEPDTPIVGFILNKVATSRQEKLIRKAVESATGRPVLGAIPRVRGTALLPDRHLGLVTPAEHEAADQALTAAAELIARSVDLDVVLATAEGAGPIELTPTKLAAEGAGPIELTPTRSEPAREEHGAPVTIGVVRDAAFSFYYPENLEALEAAGARLVEIDSLEASALPSELHGLYIGGGFPETHAEILARNESFRRSLREAAERGLPIYAECGGLILLARSMTWEGATHAMAGVLPIDVEIHRRPVGHGYCVVEVDRTNPFFPVGLTIRAHEFHYSSVTVRGHVSTAFSVRRGVGSFDKRDGLIYKNVLASYAHLHVLGCPEWASGFVDRARQYRREVQGPIREKESQD